MGEPSSTRRRRLTRGCVRSSPSSPGTISGTHSVPTTPARRWFSPTTRSAPPPAPPPLLHHASMVGYGSAGQVHIPTMFLQGEADTLFNLDEAVANYNLIKATGAPVKLVFQSWGHSNSTPRPGGFTPTGDPTGPHGSAPAQDGV